MPAEGCAWERPVETVEECHCARGRVDARVGGGGEVEVKD